MGATFPIQLAKEAILLSRYVEAADLLHPLATNNLPEAQFLLGSLYFLGSQLSPSQALDLLHQAATHGHAEAKYLLATCPTLELKSGFHLPSTPEHMRLLQDAAALDSVAAKVDFAKALLEGRQIERDRDRAEALLTEITKRRHPIYPEAHYRLGQLFLEEAKTVEDIDRAIQAMRTVVFDRDIVGNPYIIRTLDMIQGLIEQERLSERCLADVQSIQRYEEPRIRAVPLQTDWQSYLNHYCLSTLRYDLLQATFDEFVAFHFEHFVTVPTLKNIWNKQTKVVFDPPLFLKHYVRLFRDPLFLLERYSHDALEQGLWELRFMQVWSAPTVMFAAQVSLDDAEMLIRSAYDLFEKLFAVNTLRGQMCEMWWESPFDLMPARVVADDLELRADDQASYVRLIQAAFETQVKILQLDNEACQHAALHGMGHLRHPDKEKVIRQFLAEKVVSPKLYEYALAAIEGKVL